ncbi:MAG: TetR/AcrR family transcriptional regulator [Humibacter sp.]
MPRLKAANIEDHTEVVWQDIEAAVRHLLTDTDYEAITVGEVAERAGIGRNTLYRYAPDKTALMIAIARRASEPVIAHVTTLASTDRPASERVAAVIDALVTAFDDSTIRLMLQPAFLPNPSRILEHFEGPFSAVGAAMEKIVKDGVDAGEFRISADVELVTWLLSGIVRAAADRLARRSEQTAELHRVVSDLVLGALRPGTPE